MGASTVQLLTNDMVAKTFFPGFRIAAFFNVFDTAFGVERSTAREL